MGGAVRLAALAVTGRQFTRREMGLGMGAALAAMAQSPAFADEAKNKEDKEAAAKKAKQPTLPSGGEKSDQFKPRYNPLGERSEAAIFSTVRKADDPNGCSEECRAKRLEKYGY